MKHYIALERFHRSKTVLAFIDTTLSKSKLKSPVAVAVATDDSAKAKSRTPSAEEDMNNSGRGGGGGGVRSSGSSPSNSSSSSMSRVKSIDSEELYDNVVFKPAFSRAVDEPYAAMGVPTRGDFGGSNRTSANSSNSNSSDNSYLVGLADHPAMAMGRGDAAYDGGGPYLYFGEGTSSGAGILNDGNPHLNLQDDYWNLWSSSAPVVSSLRGDLFDANPSPPPTLQSSYDSLESSASSRVIGSNKFFFLKGSQDSYDNNDLSGLGFDVNSNFSFDDDFDPLLAQRSSSRTSSHTRDMLFGSSGTSRLDPPPYLSGLDAGETESYLTGTLLGVHTPTGGDGTTFTYAESIPRTISSKDPDSSSSSSYYMLGTETALDNDFSNINLAGIPSAWPFPQESSLDPSFVQPVAAAATYTESISSSFTSTGSYPLQPMTAVYADTRPHPLRSPAVSIPPPPGLDILPTHPPVTEPPPGLTRWNG